MARQTHYPSYISCVETILKQSTQPVTIEQMLAQIETMRPLGKSARSAIYQAISKLYQAVSISSGQYGWLSNLLNSQWFRHPLNAEEIRRGFLLLDELEHAVFFPEFFQDYHAGNRTIYIELLGGPMLTCEAVIERGTWSLHLGSEFSHWVNQLGGSPQDDLMIWVRDAEQGQYGLRLQPREARQEQEIAERNAILVTAAEEIVRGDRKMRETVPIWELAAALVGRGVYDYDVPPDDMNYVLHEQSKLRLLDDMGYGIIQPTAMQRNWSTLSRKSADTAPERPFWGGNPERLRNEASSWLETEESVNEQFSFDNWLDALEEYEEQFDGDEDDLWRIQKTQDALDEDPVSEYCEGYQAYLAEFYMLAASEDDIPFSHVEYHLLEAELEMLVGLEQEFGYLMAEQERRKLELADRLFIDLNFFQDEEDWDQSDYDDPPFWTN